MIAINQTTAKIIMLSCFIGAATRVQVLLNALQDSDWPTVVGAFGTGCVMLMAGLQLRQFNELLKALGRLRPLPDQEVDGSR